MKKILFIIVLFIVYPMIVFGEDFEIKEYGITMSFDQNWDVFTRDSDRNNYFLVKYDLDYDLLQKNLKDNSIYLYAINEIDDDSGIELFVVTNGKKVETSRPMNLEEFKGYAASLTEKKGAENYEFYESNYKYITYDYIDENENIYFIEYALFVDYRCYFFTFRKAAPFTDDEITQIENVIDSISVSGDGIQYVEGVSTEEVQETKEFNYQRFIINFITSFISGVIIWLIVNKFIRKKFNLNKE